MDKQEIFGLIALAGIFTLGVSIGIAFGMLCVVYAFLYYLGNDIEFIIYVRSFIFLLILISILYFIGKGIKKLIVWLKNRPDTESLINFKGI